VALEYSPFPFFSEAVLPEYVGYSPLYKIITISTDVQALHDLFSADSHLLDPRAVLCPG
jgi:hypothetical protein